MEKDRVCEFCGDNFTKFGIGNHRKKCKREHQGVIKDTLYHAQASRAEGTEATSAGPSSQAWQAPPHSNLEQSQRLSQADGYDTTYDYPTELYFEPSAEKIDSPPVSAFSRSPTPSDMPETDPQLDDFRTEFHPASGKAPIIAHFDDYGCSQQFKYNKPPDRTPWSPFKTRLDFEIAELILLAALNKEQTTTLISLLKRCAGGDESFTLRSHDEIKKKWEIVLYKCINFEKKDVVVKYKNIERYYDMHSRPLFEWALWHLDHPRIIPHFVWDAERLSKFNGVRWMRFYHEPWTGDHWWNTQSQLPPGAKPLFFILYADKTRLSSFGTEKGYPVMARIANLPVDIRNGEGIGGGQVVGWLPIVEEDSGETGKTGFVNHKQIVWHKSFSQLLENVILYSKTGFNHKCADDIVRWLFPILLILSADYEEQCVMALIRGLKGLCPCPKCLVPKDQLSDLTKTHDLRTVEGVRDLFIEAAALGAVDKDNLLKMQGLRDVQNVFHRVRFSESFRAFSFDRLRFNHGGLFSDHLWMQTKRHIDSFGRQAVKEVDDHMDLIPQWSGLNHFRAIMHVLFTDGSKNEDISKLVIYAAHTVLLKDESPLGYLLLRCLRSYIVLDMYAALEVHTTETIAAGRAEVLRFSALMNEYIEAASETEFGDKNWNFIKLHWQNHLFDDIEAKGATRNFNTKPNEKLHGPLKAHYMDRTNFKDVASQILTAEHWCSVARVMRDDLKYLDMFDAAFGENSADAEEPDDMEGGSSDHVRVGSKQRPCTFKALDSSCGDDVAFTNFRVRLAKFLNSTLEREVLPDGQRLALHQDNMINEYRYLKVNFESAVDWRQATNHLRCSPKFHNNVRRDFVIVNMGAGQPIFAQLLFLFKFVVAEREYPLALILPFDQPIPARDRPKKDVDLGFLRVRARPRKLAEFIFVESIIRGALLVNSFDSDHGDESFVIDTIDTDMFLRLRDFYTRR